MIPDGGQYLWDWYHELSSSLRRVSDGVCFPVPWSEYIAWSTISNTIVNAIEFNALHEMDLAFCDEMNKELQAYHERERDKAKRGS